jgi:hypothetical protein
MLAEDLKNFKSSPCCFARNEIIPFHPNGFHDRIDETLLSLHHSAAVLFGLSHLSRHQEPHLFSGKNIGSSAREQNENKGNLRRDGVFGSGRGEYGLLS